MPQDLGIHPTWARILSGSLVDWSRWHARLVATAIARGNTEMCLFLPALRRTTKIQVTDPDRPQV